MAHIAGEILINRPVEDVFDFVADERNEPRYNAEMRNVEQISTGPIGLGSRFRGVSVSMGRAVEMTIEFTAFDRPRRLRSTNHLSSMDIEGTLTFASLPEGTRMRWSWDLRPRGVTRLMSPLITCMGLRQERRTWTSLKRYLEAQEMPLLAT